MLDYFKNIKNEYNRSKKLRMAQRQTFNELNGCTDRELADIGIQRADILYISRQVKL